MDDGKMWSLLRNVLLQGAAIQMDYSSGRYANYEEYARRMDVAANERVDEMRAALSATDAGSP